MVEALLVLLVWRRAQKWPFYKICCSYIAVLYVLERLHSIHNKVPLWSPESCQSWAQIKLGHYQPESISKLKCLDWNPTTVWQDRRNWVIKGVKRKMCVFTSMGLTVMVSAESSQSISFSLPLSWSLMVRWCAARMRNTPRMIINTRKLTHTTMTMVAALGTTAAKQRRNKKPWFQKDRFYF